MSEEHVYIDWVAFDWQSFSTLVAGVAAVAGATVVGFRQASIAKRQADIADRQTKILDRQAQSAESQLRIALFDRRYRIYDTTSRFLSQIAQLDDRPDISLEREFLVAMHESKLLFRNSVHEDLEKIWRRAVRYFKIKSEMNVVYKAEGHYGVGNPERSRVAFEELVSDLMTLVDLFGYELKLGSPTED